MTILTETFENVTFSTKNIKFLKSFYRTNEQGEKMEFWGLKFEAVKDPKLPPNQAAGTDGYIFCSRKRLVVAFRGTEISKEEAFKDASADLEVFFHPKVSSLISNEFLENNNY